jgi:hypothetical protein
MKIRGSCLFAMEDAFIIVCLDFLSDRGEIVPVRGRGGL